MKVLHLTSELDGGGVDRLLFDYCIRQDDDIEFDFVVTSSNKGILEEELINKGYTIYHIPQIRKSFVGHIKALHEIISSGNYDIVHDHGGYKSFITFLVAIYNNVPIRIAHAHLANVPETAIQKIARHFFALLTKITATNLFGCGKEALEWMWGEKENYNKGIYIIPNAINVSSFLFNSRTRKLLRDKLNLNDKIVIGNVARFSYQKNHSFLINLFHELLSNDPNNKYILLLIGRGELYDSIKSQTKDLNIDSNVIFLGVRNDVPELLNAMDMFVLPSLYEGLPVTMVEVQANGLYSIVSDTITREICINKNVEYWSLNLGFKEWARKINEIQLTRNDSNILNSKYNIDISSKMLGRIYKKLYNDSKKESKNE